MFFVYRIQCNTTPNHLYVGQTGHLLVRILNHIAGQGLGHPFTQEHGVKSWDVVTCADTRKEILEEEIKEYKRLQALGYIVGGFAYYEASLLRKANRAEYEANRDKKKLENLMNDTLLSKILEDTTLKSMRSKSRALAPLINKTPETAMCMIRRAYKLLGR